MRDATMTLGEMARYVGVSPATLACAICNRGSLERVPLPAAVNENAPLSRRCWAPQEVQHFKLSLTRMRQRHAARNRCSERL
ncbi:hypothetical protein [Pantoea sp.]|uniref:hypothetical protein n=1 Tax=Pantoea sp. TaxID=69393 RepID=UPI0031DEC432